MIERTCLVCQKKFSCIEETQKRCPTCLDKAKGHKASQITTAREVVAAWIVENKLHQSAFLPFHSGDHHDVPALRWRLRGRDLPGFGSPYADWTGRMDVWVNYRGVPDAMPLGDPAPDPQAWPRFVRARLMRVTKAAEQELPPDQKYPKPLKFPGIYEYLAIDPLPAPGDGEIDGSLVFVVADYKTTLKGFGRQWNNSLAGAPIWKVELSGTCRSGRYGATAWLAIANQEHPIFLQKDGEEIEFS